MVRSKGALLVGISFFLAGFIRLLVSFTNIEPVASTQFIDYFICVPLIIAVIGKWMLWSNISEYVHWSEPKAPTSMKKIVDTQEAIKSSQLSEDKTQSEIAKVQMRIEAREKLLVKMLRKLIGK
jgi:amino acid permease